MILCPKTGNLHENADFSPVGADRGGRPASVMGALLNFMHFDPSKRRSTSPKDSQLANALLVGDDSTDTCSVSLMHIAPDIKCTSNKHW